MNQDFSIIIGDNEVSRQQLYKYLNDEIDTLNLHADFIRQQSNRDVTLLRRCEKMIAERQALLEWLDSNPAA